MYEIEIKNFMNWMYAIGKKIQRLDVWNQNIKIHELNVWSWNQKIQRLDIWNWTKKSMNWMYGFEIGCMESGFKSSWIECMESERKQSKEGMYGIEQKKTQKLDVWNWN